MHEREREMMSFSHIYYEYILVLLQRKYFLLKTIIILRKKTHKYLTIADSIFT